jgi:hypothetical protein
MTNESSPVEYLRERIEEELVNVLAGMRLLQQADSRIQYVQILRDRLGDRVQVRDFPDPRGQSVEIAHACLPMPDAVASMVKVPPA